MRISRILLAASLFVAIGLSADAQDRTVDVRFPAGATGTSISDSVSGRDAVLYRIGAEAGQTMSVAMTANNAATYFNIYEPGRGLGDEALVIGEFTDPMNAWVGTLPASGEYTVAVFLYRAAARRGESSSYTLDLSVTGAMAPSVQADYADGLEGGPDFFEVAVSGGGQLNMRSAPSAGAAVVTQLRNGQGVRNLGCRMSEGRRWCQIATLADPGAQGWAAGEFLIEGTGQASAPAATPVASGGGGGETRVQFAAGTSGAELRGTLAPGESHRYLLNARDGQNLYTRVAPDGGPISYQIFNPDRSFLLEQISSDREYRGQLWQSGDHVIEVINRTGAPSGYSVIIGIE
ncbi:SH3 domain-containing protein [Litorisediminicola beolgyonensis]|uniref:SH3 domain-containing protein n=1 Tax=Litorisediminicola beolgyonensis TaxID=1173614 RepID=A0ABW3ZE83_9RHOB